MRKQQSSDVLLKSGAMRLGGRISPKTELAIIESLAYFSVQHHPFLTLFISSKGGSMECALRLFELLKSSSKQVVGIVEDEAYSMAAIVLQGCFRRKARKGAHLLFHNVRPAEHAIPSDELDEKRKKGQEAIYKILSDRSGKTIEEVAAICRKDKKMSAEEALELGFIDEII